MSDEAVTTEQAPALSPQERVYSHFGGKLVSATSDAPETAEATETAAKTPAEAAVAALEDLEWNGIRFTGPPNIKEALLRQQDYTRKTQELAEKRSAVDVMEGLAQQRQAASAFSESVQAEQRELSLIDEYLGQSSRLDWSKMTTEQMLRTKVEIDSIKERRDALKSTVEQKRTKFNEDMQARIKELKGKAREVAAKRIGDFSEQTEAAVRKYAVSEGFTEAETDSILLHPLSAVTLWKAAQYDKVKAGTKEAAEKATKAPPTLRPGAAGVERSQEAAKKLNLSKELDGARNSGQKAAAIERYLQGKFGG